MKVVKNNRSNGFNLFFSFYKKDYKFIGEALIYLAVDNYPVQFL